MSFTILYVDDCKEQHDTVGKHLKENYNLISGYNGAEGIELFRAFSPNLTITDLDMPLVNGFGMCLYIRSEDKNMPIIIYSAGLVQEDYDRAKEIGITEILEKSHNLEPLDALILNLISQSLSTK